MTNIAMALGSAAPFLLLGPVLWGCDVLCQPAWSAREARLAFLRAFLLSGGMLVLLTETLNIFHALTRQVVSISWWVIFGLSAGGLLYLTVRHLACGKVSLMRLMPSAKAEWARVSASPWRMLFWAVIAIWFLILLVTALVAAPNTTDSMTYRLTRVMHWVSNQSVDFFPTEMPRQNHRSPLAEWEYLHMVLLTGNDYLLNLVQWLSFAGVAVAVYELTNLFSPWRVTRYVAVTLAITTPMAILQATSTQSDLLASFLFLTFLIFGFRMVAKDRRDAWQRVTDGVFCGLALGLGLLAKSTNFLYAGFFALWFAFLMFRRVGWRALPAAAPCAALSLLLIAGHSWRNQQMYHHIMGSPGDTPFRAEEGNDPDRIVMKDANDRMTVPFFLSNLLRNAAMHLQTPMKNVNDSLEWAMWEIHRKMGITPCEPAITFPGSSFQPSDLRHEDVVGNPLHALLFLGAWGAILIFRRKVPAGMPLYGLILLAAFVSISFLLRWQPWHPRLELPLFLAACPFMAVVLPFEGSQLLALGVSAVCACYAFPFLADNAKRPLFGRRSIFTLHRTAQYFTWNDAEYEDFQSVGKLLKAGGYREVGVQADRNCFYYPLWPFLQKNTKRYVHFYQVNVTNASRKVASYPPPEVVVVVYPFDESHLKVGDAGYKKTWQGKTLSLFERIPDER